MSAGRPQIIEILFKITQRIIPLSAILIGVIFVSIGLEMFLTPHRIIPGGIKGIAILLSHVTEMKMGLLLLFINLPFVIFKRRNLTQTCIALITFLVIAILTIFMHPFPPLLHDPLLAAICGGITFGIGVGLVVRYGWYADGVNDVAFYLKKKTQLSISEVLMIINIFILSCGGFLFGWDQAIHSIIAYVLAYKSIQFTLDYNSRQLICVSSDSLEEITQLLIQEFDQDIQFLTPTSRLVNTKTTDLFFVLSKNKIKKFKMLISNFESSDNVVVSYANYSQTEPYYRM